MGGDRAGSERARTVGLGTCLALAVLTGAAAPVGQERGDRGAPAAASATAETSDWQSRAEGIQAALLSPERDAALAAARSLVDFWPELERLAGSGSPDRDAALATMVSIDLTATQPRDPEVIATLPARAQLVERARANAARVAEPKYRCYLGATVVQREAALALENGEHARARAILELGVAEFGSDLAMGPYLRLELADHLRSAREWSAVEQQLGLVEASLREQASTWRADTSTLVRLHAIRSQVEMELGVLDAAARSIDAARRTAEAALAEAPDDPYLANALGHVLLQEGTLRLASDLDRSASATFTRALEDPRLRAIAPDLRDAIELRAALAEAHLARRAGASAAASDGRLRRAIDSPYVRTELRLDAEMALAESAMRENRLDDAKARLRDAREAFRALREHTAPLEYRAEGALLSAWEARLARTRGDPREELDRILERLERDWSSFLDQWRAVPARPGGVGFLHSRHRRIALSELIALALAVDGRDRGARRSLSAVLAAHDQGSIARSVGAAPTSVDMLSRVVPPEGVLLVWSPGSLEAHVFEIDAERIVVHDLPGFESYESQVKELDRAIHQRHDAGAEAKRARQLAAEIAPFVLPRAVRDRLRSGAPATVVGIELMGHLPLELLPLDDGRSLGAAVALDRLPSVPVGLWLDGRARAERQDAIAEVIAAAATEPGPGAIAGGAKVAPFRFDQDDAVRLLAGWPGARARLWSGHELTSERMRGFEVAQATALYLVAHGVFDATRARPVGLALAGAAGHDGVAWADDVEGWRVPELVFLATCSAARDQERAGEDGTSHLGGAFLRAGARCVITSRYALELGVTNVLAQRFFTALGRGELPAAAMRWARAELSSDPLYADALEPELLVVFGLGR